MPSPTATLTDVARRARRHVALRLLPFVFLVYVVNYMDRVNVSFANLRMSADLGFSDKVYGLGVGIFYVSYVLFEIPGALIVERWSARKWIARIMISWGIVTIFTGFVHSATQFYAARFFLGLAEASFFPGMIIYLTHWFCARDRSRAIACLYTAVPTASLIGAPIAGQLLGVQWLHLAGWRWLFIAEGIPAVILGVITIFYLTDWPAEAGWLPADEREWLIKQLDAELHAKKKSRDHTILEAFQDPKILGLTASWFLALSGFLGSIYFLPTVVKRLSSLPNREVTTLLIIPALIGMAGTLINGWHSDKTSERRWHTAIPVLAAGLMYGLAFLNPNHAFLTIACLLLGSGFFYAYQPTFWAIPTLILSESAAAATFGLINMVGQLGGILGPYAVGFLNDRTHALSAGFAFISLTLIASGSVILFLKIHNPLEDHV